MQKYFQIVVTKLIRPKIETNWLTEVKMRHVNDFYRVEQLHLLKLKAFLNFESSTHSVVVKWPVELSNTNKYAKIFSITVKTNTAKNWDKLAN